MGRRRKGRDISGWLVVDKPAGPTSTTVVNKVRWALNANKAGHAGTLDPEATGVLAIALGEATKTVPFITDAMKAYEFTVRLCNVFTCCFTRKNKRKRHWIFRAFYAMNSALVLSNHS